MRDALDGAITAISAAGCETPRLDAELLLAHVLGVTRAQLTTGWGSSPEHELHVAGPAVRAFQDAVRRRAVNREPVAYIIGHRSFRHLELAVDSRALIPRPDTELLVELAVAQLPQNAHVLDVGTGSGAIALALADERPDLYVVGSDISEDALALARANGERLGLSVLWLQSDMLADMPDQFDAILSNLPYIAESEQTSLAPEILHHEPSRALFAGPDGLACIRELIAQVAKRKHVQMVALEVGAGQASTVSELVCAAGFAGVRSKPDLAGIERVVIGERSAQ